jgi:hypothetical protein
MEIGSGLENCIKQIALFDKQLCKPDSLDACDELKAKLGDAITKNKDRLFPAESGTDG